MIQFTQKAIMWCIFFATSCDLTCLMIMCAEIIDSSTEAAERGELFFKVGLLRKPWACWNFSVDAETNWPEKPPKQRCNIQYV